jgi:Hint domain
LGSYTTFRGPKCSVLRGAIHFALYSGVVLSAAQVATHAQAFCNLGETYYDQELTYDGATNLWKLNETSGTTAADSIGSNTGTYKNSPTLNQTSPVITVLGTPQIAFPFNCLAAMQQQNLHGYVPLSGAGVPASTAVPGTYSGGGSSGGYGGGAGRGGSTCFTGDTLIKTNRGDVPIKDIREGDFCLTAKGTWCRVLKLIEHEAARSFVQTRQQRLNRVPLTAHS